MPKIRSGWDPGHQYGWFIYRGDECIAKLDYVGIDDPRNLFKFTPLSREQEDLSQLIKALHHDMTITYHNAQTNQIANAVEFIINNYEHDIVAIRDLRLPPMRRTLFELLKSFFVRPDRSGWPNRS